jgi:hypothetical protein
MRTRTLQTGAGAETARRTEKALGRKFKTCPESTMHCSHHKMSATLSNSQHTTAPVHATWCSVLPAVLAPVRLLTTPPAITRPRRPCLHRHRASHPVCLRPRPHRVGRRVRRHCPRCNTWRQQRHRGHTRPHRAMGSRSHPVRSTRPAITGWGGYHHRPTDPRGVRHHDWGAMHVSRGHQGGHAWHCHAAFTCCCWWCHGGHLRGHQATGAHGHAAHRRLRGLLGACGDRATEQRHSMRKDIDTSTERVLIEVWRQGEHM